MKQPVEAPLLARDVEPRSARSVEQRNAGEDRPERFLLAAFLCQQRLDSLGEVAEIRETERRGEIGQGSGMDRAGREGESDVRQRQLASILEQQHEPRSRTQRTDALFHLDDLAPADTQLLARARLQESHALSV